MSERAPPAFTELSSRLRRARLLISSSQGWSASGYATDAAGRWRPVGAADAVRFSLIGAAIRAGVKPKELMEVARHHLETVVPALYATLASADAELSHAESLEVLDTLIAALERPTRVPTESGFIRVREVPGDTSVEDGSLRALGERLLRIRDRGRS